MRKFLKYLIDEFAPVFALLAIWLMIGILSAGTVTTAQTTRCSGDLLGVMHDGSWLIHDNVYRVRLNRPTSASQQYQIADIMMKLGTCYHIRSVTATTESSRNDGSHSFAGVVQVWNDSLLIVMERKR